MMQLNQSFDVKIIEVGPRDGLQNEPIALSVEQRLAFIQLLAAAGLQHIEVGSFVSPKWVPQMANSDKLLQQLNRSPDICYSALVPNEQGMTTATLSKPNEISIFTAASESFCRKNINCSIEESFERFLPVIQLAQIQKIPIRGYVSCVVDCPYEGAIEPEQVLRVSKQLLAMGCYEVSLGDTIGTATPNKIQSLINVLNSEIPLEQLAVHFHDTYGQALANIYAALELGIRSIDSACAGLGGCPYADGASGNVATEDVLYMLNGMGLSTGVNMKKLLLASQYIGEQLGRPNASKVGRALACKLAKENF
jgi:hydroxymethylglutaryl-CoA lyase